MHDTMCLLTLTQFAGYITAIATVCLLASSCIPLYGVVPPLYKGCNVSFKYYKQQGPVKMIFRYIEYTLYEDMYTLFQGKVTV